MEGGRTFIVCFSSCLFVDWFCSFVFGTICNNWVVYVFGRRGRMSQPLSIKKITAMIAKYLVNTHSVM